VHSLLIMRHCRSLGKHAARQQFAAHKKISRYTFPIWLYVSVTGVLVFFFLRAYT